MNWDEDAMTQGGGGGGSEMLYEFGPKRQKTGPKWRAKIGVLNGLSVCR